MLLDLLTLLLLTEGMKSELLATLSPPHHLPSPFSSVAPTAPGIPSPGGLTILVCVISNVLHAGDLEVAWISTRSRSGSGSEGAALPASYSLIRGQDGSHSAMAVISVASSEWQSYMCFVSHRGVATSAVTQSQYVVGFPNTTTDSEPDQLDQCEEDESSTFSIYAVWILEALEHLGGRSEISSGLK
ncbi:uncharacterized protein LOC134445946 isoform X2 [Engraulis encrasicolus]|uniref:uncharacterized protein LOC134445946 isoform X2 n=1 Tax=Engraulis encrasicolus TaxID=184585 RepID=UPI002FD62EB9